MDALSWLEISRHAQFLVDGYAGRVPVQAHMNASWHLRDGWLYILGTNDREDWLQNLSGLISTPMVLRGGLFHSGFEAHADLVDEMLSDPQRRALVGIAGHSLGGAAAHCLGIRYRVPVVSFGAPRPWRRAHGPTDVDGCTHLRIAHAADPVPRIPTRWRWQHWQTRQERPGPSWLWGTVEALWRREWTWWHWMGRYRDTAVSLSTVNTRT